MDHFYDMKKVVKYKDKTYIYDRKYPYCKRCHYYITANNAGIVNIGKHKTKHKKSKEERIQMWNRKLKNIWGGEKDGMVAK